MMPAQRNKIDISKLSEEEQKLFRLYGKLPTHKNNLMKMQKERKYFDSGDYALSKAGVAPQTNVGTAIPNPQNIPHASTPSINTVNKPHESHSISPTNSTSPIRESLLAQDAKLPQAQDESTMLAETTTVTTTTTTITPSSVTANTVTASAEVDEDEDAMEEAADDDE